ncbi:MAG: biopolymer transport protein ExbB [Candidatus Binatota bacterium]|jgi:biopolymer transport protein ExbB|nr:biopolymer transport protein ExbB [Candidatus Binatota bacterium]
MEPSSAVNQVAQSGTVAEAIKAFTLLGGDWVLWILILASIVSVTVIIERALYFWRNRTPIERFLTALTERMRGEDVKGATALADVTGGAEARIAKVGLNHFSEGDEVVEDFMISQKVAERLRFERYLMILGTMGNNAPFIGLFGTVLGIIKAFHDLSMMGGNTGSATAVMGGISEALVATAMGLLVAIPAVIAYNYFNKKVREFAANAETIERMILAHLRSAPSAERKLRSLPA